MKKTVAYIMSIKNKHGHLFISSAMSFENNNVPMMVIMSCNTIIVKMSYTKYTIFHFAERPVFAKSKLFIIARYS